MKKILSLILTLFLLMPVFANADLDVSAMSDQELKDTIAACSAELRARATVSPDWVLLFEYRSVKVYQTGDAEIDRFGRLIIPVAIINDMDYPVLISIQDAKCNGWEIFSDGCSTKTGNSKVKDILTFDIRDANIESIDQIDSLTFSWWFINRDNTKDSFTDEYTEHRFW